MKRLIFNLVLSLAIGSAWTFASEIDKSYQVYQGDHNNDGKIDFLVTSSQIVFLHGDIIVPVKIGSDEGFVLEQQADQTFQIIPNSSSSNTSWQDTVVDVVIRDLNIDGLFDVLLKGVNEVINGVFDQIVFSSINGISAFSLRQVDTDFIEFFRDTNGYIDDPGYYYQDENFLGVYCVDGYYAPQIGWVYDPYLDRSYLGIVGYYAVCTEYAAYYDGSIFNGDAIEFTRAISEAFHDPGKVGSVDPSEAEQIFENVLGVDIGDNIFDILFDPIPLPELPSSTPWPYPRNPPSSLPGSSSEVGIPQADTVIKILRKGNIIICALLTCSVEGDTDKWWDWYVFGEEWALQDLIDNEVDSSDAVKVVIGEGEGEGLDYDRIPDAADQWGAIIFEPGEFTDPANYTIEDEKLLWGMNQGWVELMMARQATFYDIGLFPARSERGRFYPCEREVLKVYPWRTERDWNTLNWDAEDCEIESY